MRVLGIAALQITSVPGDRAATLSRFADQVRAAKEVAPETQLVVAPELHLEALPGIFEASTGAAAGGEEIPGPLTESLAEIARGAGVWLVPGSIFERAGEGRYNTAVVLAPDGRIAARYRKAFPWQPRETSLAGGEFVVVDIPECGRIGLAICYDGFFPEAFRQLGWLGAEVVVQPTLTTTSDRAAELVTARANAIVNQVYVVNVNAATPAMGRSLIVDPEGLVRHEAGTDEELLTDVLDLDAVTRVQERGTAGVSRMWDQIDRGEATHISFPAYEGGGLQPRPGRPSD